MNDERKLGRPEVLFEPFQPFESVSQIDREKNLEQVAKKEERLRQRMREIESMDRELRQYKRETQQKQWLEKYSREGKLGYRISSGSVSHRLRTLEAESRPLSKYRSQQLDKVQGFWPTEMNCVDYEKGITQKPEGLRTLESARSKVFVPEPQPKKLVLKKDNKYQLKWLSDRKLQKSLFDKHQRLLMAHMRDQKQHETVSLIKQSKRNREQLCQMAKEYNSKMEQRRQSSTNNAESRKVEKLR